MTECFNLFSLFSLLKVYTVLVTKKQLPRYVRLTDAEAAMEFECPISLSPLYCPVTIKGSEPKHTFSAPFIDEFTKLSKFDPLNNVPLDKEWRISDTEIDKKISAASACIPLTNGGEEGLICVCVCFSCL